MKTVRIWKIFLLLLSVLASTVGKAEPETAQSHLQQVCRLIEQHSARYGLSPHFLARLLWKESRFDPNAISPKGAEGVAQFMPATAVLRGVSDSFDMEQAIPASAEYLSELQERFGNLGLAAAAYNAGEARVTRWLANGGFLPIETENYVLDILGEPVDHFINRAKTVAIAPLHAEKSFDEACRDFPMMASTTIAMARLHTKPWGVQVAGHFRRNVAIHRWERMSRQVESIIPDEPPVISRIRSPRGRNGIYAVRLGAESRERANEMCRKIQNIGASCIVLRNR